MIFSVSELETYARCPMAYYLKHHRGIPAQDFNRPALDELPGNIVGDLVHAVIRDMLTDERHSVDDCVQKIACEQELPASLIPLDEVRNLCERALSYHRAQGWLEMHVETAFSITIGHAIVRGTIDFLGRTANGWHLVDYKTDQLAAKSVMAEHAKNYHLQMTTYALAATRAGLTPLIDTTLLFLRLDAPVNMGLDGQTITASAHDIDKIIAAIAAEKWEAGINPPCRTCPYHHNGLCWEDKLKKTQPA